MQVVRYLNGKKLDGAMPRLVLKDKGLCSMLGGAVLRKELPLRKRTGSAILEPEGSGSGKEKI